MWRRKDDRFYTLEVSLVSGPMTRKFVRKNPRVVRTIQARGDDTLEELHEAIFVAFGREDEHMYEFQLGGKGPTDPKARKYGSGGVSSRTAIGSLGLKVGQAFGYWFDFGDDWFHQIDVLAIDEEAPRGKYPRIGRRVGQSPPQYPNMENEA